MIQILWPSSCPGLLPSELLSMNEKMNESIVVVRFVGAAERKYHQMRMMVVTGSCILPTSIERQQCNEEDMLRDRGNRVAVT